MNPFVKETLEKQLRILSDRSVTAQDAYVAPITAQMIRLVQMIDPELRSQSFAEALSPLPAATLSMTDLEEITAVRKERLRRADDVFRQTLEEIWNKTQFPPAEVLDELLGNPKPRD